MIIRLFMVAALTVGAASARADCVSHSNASSAHVIELYTSEGCSSCPQAERWLGGLPADDASLIALEFHVDYWDSLGWRDRFADASYTARQQKLAAHAPNGTVYTPQVILDGKEWRNWYRGSLPQAVAPSLTLDLRIHPGNSIKADLGVAAANGADISSLRGYFAITENDLTSAVHAGENRGATLHHDHVVRKLVGPFAVANAVQEIALPADALPNDLKIQNAAIVAFVANPRDGSIVQAVRLPLNECVDRR